MPELNTLSPKKWEGNYGGTNPTLDSANGVRVGDMAIDTSIIGYDFPVWTCASNTAGNSIWTPITETGKTISGTGLISGGLLTINTSSGSITFDITAGHGIITDQTTPDNQIVKVVKWNNFTNVSATYLTSDIRSSIFIQSDGTIYQTNTPVSFLETRDYIFIGRLLHSNKTTISQASTLPRVVYDTGFEADDIAQSLGNINISGNIYSANGANLNINKSSGQSFRLGANYTNSTKLPNITTDNPGTAITFQYRYRDGYGGFKTGSNTTTVDPSNYDTGATSLTPVPTTGGSKWTIQRIYFFRV